MDKNPKIHKVMYFRTDDIICHTYAHYLLIVLCRDYERSYQKQGERKRRDLAGVGC